MRRSVILDSGPLFLILNPKRRSPTGENDAGDCLRWFQEGLLAGHRFFVPATVHHEAHRGALVHVLANGSTRSVDRLSDLLNVEGVQRLPMNDGVLLMASELWARAKVHGYLPAPKDTRFVGDVMVAAEAERLRRIHKVIAMENVKHFTRLFSGASLRYAAILWE